MYDKRNDGTTQFFPPTEWLVNSNFRGARQPHVGGRAPGRREDEDLSPTLNTSEMPRYENDIIEETFSLTLDYISYRLRSRFEQSRLRALPGQFLVQWPTNASTSTLRKLATHMEAEHPDLFEPLCTKLRVTTVSAYPTFVAVAQEIFRPGTNWGRIVALFTSGGVVAKALPAKRNVGLWGR